MQRIEIIGNLAKDAQEITKQSGDTFVSFTVIVNSKHGEEETKTTYECNHRKTGVFSYLKTGKKVYVEGMPVAKAFTTKDGELVAKTDINVSNLELL